ncbi:MAG TPA: hypothetical protein VEF53_18430 [Patescibacteria group bacterium]|nr:hypothetical protein [Patescibacteria group bacterium]
MRKLNEYEIEALAIEVRQFLLDNSLWVDVAIYFNGKAFCTSDENGKCYCNDPNHLLVLESKDPRNYLEFCGDLFIAEPHVFSMIFEGGFCGCMSFYYEYGVAFDNRTEKEFSDILKKYGLYYKHDQHWNLRCYYL